MGIDDTRQFDTQPTQEFKRVTAVKHTRRVGVTVLGSVLIIGGIALIPLPGPFSLPLVFLGLTVLSWEFPWAKRLLFRIKQKVKDFRDSHKNKNKIR